MNKQELIGAIAAVSDVPKSTVDLVLSGLTAVVYAELGRQAEVTIPGIGKLKSSFRPSREGRNPATGETLVIGSKNAPKFTAAKALKDALN